ncbi:lasso peptide biosynthesis PqqD family chaperone [Streptomyces longispororuber]|uniref:lasso peptide biosynthesis PqqD family chaperone n=1 Tax=Streptomyces longispororuber TaxID=68230 RepID=UPI0036F9FA47
MTLALKPDVTATDTEDGLVLLDQRSGRYWQLNRSGATALRLLLDGHTPEETAARLTRRHPDAAGRALTDVRTLLAALDRARLVVTA